VEAARLVFAPAIPHARHLARHALADLALDTHHHSGGVTTVDAMRVAVPVVTCPGTKPNGRTSASILAAMEARDLIAADLDGYEKLAQALASDPDKRAAIRARLARVRRSAPLFDRKALARRLEAAYRRMIERRASGLAPAPFRVAE
jgi:predicted O-linked N-acetylglucosamine transferase (SPINDLY family)